MKLHQLLRSIPDVNLSGLPDLEISALTADSRLVKPGHLFVAIPGTSLDGHDFLPDAINRGAVFAVGQRDVGQLTIPYLKVVDTRKTFASLAATWHGNPAHQMIMVGITGTDGKTTTANLLYEILRKSGHSVGMITTVNAHIGDQIIDTGFHVTTPDAMDLQGYLARMLEEGMDCCILEATSHGLAQYRVGACEFDLGIVTNITHEHLDFHGSYEAYRAAKGLLFEDLGRSEVKVNFIRKKAVLNRDDSSYEYLASITEVEKVHYGASASADVRYDELESDAHGIRFKLVDGLDEFLVQSQLLGGYNASNLLAAYTAAVHGFSTDPTVALREIENFRGVPGRMESFNLGQTFTAIVDFAHTPNALQRALEASRELCEGRIIAVFGSAGLRDREKRRLMAGISAELADITILTAEDPRTESLDGILQEMADGARALGGEEQKTFWRIPDRGNAIRFAVNLAGDQDLVIACGKGHEQSMCFGTVEYPWDDRIAMRAALAELLQVDGPAMPQLPTSSS